MYSARAEPIAVPSFKGNRSERIRSIADSTAMVDIVESVFTLPETDDKAVKLG